MQTYLKTRPVWIQILIFTGLALGLLAVFSMIGVLILSSITGVNPLQMQDVSKWDPKNPNIIFFIRGMLLLQFLGLFLIPSFLFAYMSDPKPRKYLGLQIPKNNVYWILGITALVVSIPFVEASGILNQELITGGTAQKWMKSMEEEAAKQIQFMLARHTPTELILNLIFISVFAGVGEELFFRGVLQRLFIQLTKSPWAGILITAMIFSAIHLQFYGFLPRFFLGVLLGAVYWYSGSLWTAILAHFLYDGLVIVIIYFNPQMAQDPNATLTHASGVSLIAFVSLVLTAMILWQMKKKSDTRYEEVYNNTTPLDELTF